MYNNSVMFGELALGASNVVQIHGVAWDQPADLSSRAVQEKLSPVAIRAFFRLASHWKLRDEDARGLIGGISNGSFYQLKRSTTKTSNSKTLDLKTLDQDKEPLTVSVNVKGEVYLQNTEIPLEELVPKLKAITEARGGAEERIFVRGDKQVDYGTVMKVMGRISAAGFRRVALVTEIEQGSGR